MSLATAVRTARACWPRRDSEEPVVAPPRVMPSSAISFERYRVTNLEPISLNVFLSTLAMNGLAPALPRLLVVTGWA
jgi:hypothetical protein